MSGIFCQCYVASYEYGTESHEDNPVADEKRVISKRDSWKIYTVSCNIYGGISHHAKEIV